MAMVSATVTQYYIYKMSPCGTFANTCEDADGNALSTDISVWVEYAFTKAPKNLRSTVQAITLFVSAISSALSQALVSLADDPLLVWNYGVVAALAAIGGTAFWLDNRKIDKEDKMNMLPDAEFIGRDPVSDVESG